MTVVHHAIWIILSVGVASLRDSPDQRLRPGCSPCEARFDLALDKATYEVGEPMILTVRIINIASAPLEMWVSSDEIGRTDGYAFAVTDAKGTRISDPGEGSISGLHSIGK